MACDGSRQMRRTWMCIYIYRCGIRYTTITVSYVIMRRRNQPSLGRRLHKWEHHRHPLAATWMKVLKGRDAKRPWRIMTLSDIVTGIFLHSGHSGWDLDTPKGRYSQSPSQVRTSFKKEFGSVYEGPFFSAMYLVFAIVASHPLFLAWPSTILAQNLSSRCC